MNQSAFLISQYLINEYPVLKNLKGNDVRKMLHRFLKDPRLWEKIAVLRSEKYTKQYQSKGQKLRRIDFYPVPSDWCFLSILSNASGFSRCYIFIHLLKYDLGELKLEDDETSCKVSEKSRTVAISCHIILNLEQKTYQRKPQTIPPHPKIPDNPVISVADFSILADYFSLALHEKESDQ